MKAPYFYTSLENQIRDDGSQGLLYQHYLPEDDETPEQLYERALAKLYTVLAAAAVSKLPYHSGHLYRSDGLLVDGRVFDRRVAPDPEPEVS